MGFGAYIKQVKSALAEARRMAKMSSKQLLSLDDETLCNTLSIRLLWETRWKKSRADNAEFYHGAKRVFYVIKQYVAEMNNGGLCQYFINPSRLAAPYLLESMQEIGSFRYAELLNDFLTENGIDVTNLDSFIIKDLSEFQEQNRRYPFDAYDDAFYALYGEEPLLHDLMVYVRRHMEEFAADEPG